MKNLTQLFETLISNEVVSIESIKPYRQRLLILLTNHYENINKVTIKYINLHNSDFYIIDDITKDCQNNFLKSYKGTEENKKYAYDTFFESYLCNVTFLVKVLAVE